MITRYKLPACLLGAAAAMSLAATGANAACVFTPALTTQTKCVTAIHIPGNPLRSFDISFVNEKRAEYYFADRSNAAVQVIDIKSLTWKRSLGGFVGIKLNAMGNVNNNISGPDGVASHGRWLYGGDGDSTLKIFDLEAPPAHALKQVISTGGSTRVDEMALTANGRLLIAANNAEDPPFATLFRANGNEEKSDVDFISRITVDNAIMPQGFGLSIEQPAWDPGTKRFYTSLPVIANNPPGCNYGQVPNPPPPNPPNPITCDGGVLVVDPAQITQPFVTLGAFDTTKKTGVIALHACGPNGATVGPNENILLGCTPQNNPSDVITLVLNAVSRTQTPIDHITGSDEVWYNAGDNRYYTGSSRDCGLSAGCPHGGAVLGVIDAATNTLIEKVPQSSNSHSVAASSKGNFIFVPQVGAASLVGSGGDTTPVGAGICGDNLGCVAVFQHKVKGKDNDDVAANDE